MINHFYNAHYIKEGVMNKRGRPRKFDQQQALRQAMLLFWQKGFDNTSMPDLAKAMNINAPSIYAAFGSKEDLFEQAVEYYESIFGENIWANLSDDPTAKGAVERVLKQSALHYTRTETPRGCLISNGALAVSGGNTQVREKLCFRRNQCKSLLTARIEQGVSAGELSQQVDVSALATFYMSVQQGMSIQARDGATKEQLLASIHLAMLAWPN